MDSWAFCPMCFGVGVKGAGSFRALADSLAMLSIRAMLWEAIAVLMKVTHSCKLKYRPSGYELTIQ